MQKVAFWKGNVGEILFHLARFDFCWGVCPFGARALWWMACPAWEMPRAALLSLGNCAWTMHDMNFWSILCWNGANWRLLVMIFVGGMCVKLKFENKNWKHQNCVMKWAFSRHSFFWRVFFDWFFVGVLQSIFFFPNAYPFSLHLSKFTILNQVFLSVQAHPFTMFLLEWNILNFRCLGGFHRNNG